MTKTSNRFDTEALKWDQKPMHVERATAVAKQLLKQVEPTENCDALEFGCGTGLLGFTLLSHLGRLTFCDISQPMLNQVKEKIDGWKLSNATTIQANLSEKPLKGKKYDLIFSLMTLHHIADLERTIRNLTEMLQPGGILCIADLNEDDGSYHLNQHTEHHGINQEMLKALFLKYGLKQVEASVPYIIQKNLEGTSHEYPVFLMSGRKSE
ncbi:MAG: class I SAM-dependent methyltransferase [Marinifilaceae bacterium]